MKTHFYVVHPPPFSRGASPRQVSNHTEVIHRMAGKRVARERNRLVWAIVKPSMLCAEKRARYAIEPEKRRERGQIAVFQPLPLRISGERPCS